jgi:hypothetical protein
MGYNRNSDEALGKNVGVDKKPLPSLSQALAWAHLRQHALQEIREKYPDHPASAIAGRAMTIGPDSVRLADMANRAMEAES